MHSVPYRLVLASCCVGTDAKLPEAGIHRPRHMLILAVSLINRIDLRVSLRIRDTDRIGFRRSI